MITNKKEGKHRSYGYWTQKDYRILRQLHKKKTLLKIAQILNRTHKAVIAKAGRLGLEHKARQWTQREIELLQKKYATTKTQKLAKRFHWSVKAVQAKASSLGLKKSREIITSGGRKWSREQIKEILRVYKNHNTRQTALMLGYPLVPIRSLLHRLGINKTRPWTRKENKLIKRYYDKIPYKDLAKKLGRNFSAVYYRLYQLGLFGLTKPKQWNDGEIKRLKKEYKKGKTVPQIASLLGRSRKACRSKISHLGLRKRIKKD